MLFHHERHSIQGIVKSLKRKGISPYNVNDVRTYLTDSEFKIYCQEYVSGMECFIK
jgi:hypothetical protein